MAAVRVALAFTCLTAALAGAAWAQDALVPREEAVMMPDSSRLWFVELSRPPVADGTQLSEVLEDQGRFRATARRLGVRFREHRAHQTLWNGLVLAVQPAEVAKLRAVSGVAATFPVVAMEVPESLRVDEANLTALTMTGADIAQRELGLSGAGIRVGVIDSGIDYDHADLGGDGVARSNSSFFPTRRVIAGYDFVGDAFRSGEAPVEDPYPDDCGSHGTHVAGIIGANGSIKGVAPEVLFGAYRVFGCDGATTADIVIAAMERAFHDGMKVINMSLGAAFQWPSYPTARASERLSRSGVVVVASFGNSAVYGLYSGSAPGIGNGVIGVAAFDNTVTTKHALLVSPDDHPITYVQKSIEGLPPEGTFRLKRVNLSSLCDFSPQANEYANCIAVLCTDDCGSCSPTITSKKAEEAGAVGLVYCEYPDVGPPYYWSTGIPVLQVSCADGALLRSRLAAQSVSVTLGALSTTPNRFGGRISSFSSYGLSPDLTVKPDIGAPGGFIRSTIPIEMGATASFSGTSMASPHVAGAVALLWQARPNISPGTVRSILQNNAVPLPFRPRPDRGPESVHRQGAGLLRVDAAVRATTRIEPGALGLGETGNGAVTQSLLIVNESAISVSYDLSHVDAVATGPDTFEPTFPRGSASVTFSQNPVVVPPGQSATVKVAIAPSQELPDRSVFGGYLLCLGDDGSLLHVPFAGLKGDYQSIPVMTSPDPPSDTSWPDFYRNRPCLVRVRPPPGFGYTPLPEGTTYIYSMEGWDHVQVAVHLDHPASHVTMDVFDARSGKNWGRALRLGDVPRNALLHESYLLRWEGSTTLRNKGLATVPDGEYVLRISVVRALGNPNNPAHTESWTSPVIRLTRPMLAASHTSESTEANAGARMSQPDEVERDVAPMSTPIQLFLDAGKPDPAGGGVVFRFGLPEPGSAMFEVHDGLGRRLMSRRWERLGRGVHTIIWDGVANSQLPTATVVYRLRAMGRTLTRRLILPAAWQKGRRLQVPTNDSIATAAPRRPRE